MVLSIKDPKTEALAREISKLTGESLTMATRRSLEERLKHVQVNGRTATLREELCEIRHRMKALPVLDTRSEPEILGFGPNGLPGRW